MDIRTSGIDPAKAQMICDELNADFWYDTTRAHLLCALNETEEWCKAKGLSETDIHIHLQACDLTRRKNP